MWKTVRRITDEILGVKELREVLKLLYFIQKFIFISKQYECIKHTPLLNR